MGMRCKLNYIGYCVLPVTNEREYFIDSVCVKEELPDCDKKGGEYKSCTYYQTLGQSIDRLR